jgi:glycosyltransferase involved in cell wall biosynthesis
MNLPFISIIMPAFNEEKYIGSAIDSILAQTHKDFELIIIDDYSTDHTIDVCNGYNDSRIRIVTKKHESKYPAASRNMGVALSRGDYVVFHDADDCSHPERVEKQLIKALEIPGKRIVGCSVFFVEGTSERILILPEKHEEIIPGFNRIFNRATIVSGIILAPKKILQRIQFREQLRYFEDWDLVLRLYESGEVDFYNCQEPLYRYYIRNKGVLFQSGWIDDNLYVRNCQMRRRKCQKEFSTVTEYFKYIDHHPFEKMKWLLLKYMILFKRYIYLQRVAQNLG